MADPKYANLAGIAYDQPDVYETKDLPEADQNAEIFEEESDSIERLHISASTASIKFKGKAIDSTNVDFSDRLSKRIRTGYIARSGDWELAGEGEKETPIQKYQRLQCELNELLDQVSELKENAKDETNKQPCGVVRNQVEALSKQLTDLNLDEQLGTELVGSLTDPQGSHIKKLVSQLDQFQVSTAVKVEKGTVENQGGNMPVNFQLTLRPSRAQLSQTSRLAEVEQRLARLEQAVGTTPAKISRLGGGERSLLDTAQYLASRAALLDSAQLDAAESRLTMLLGKLDQVAEKTTAINGSNDPDRDRKINELYELAKKAKSLSQNLPQTLERLSALQNLHQKGGDFGKSVSDMEAAQVRLMEKLRSNEELLTTMEDGLKTNFTKMKTGMESLDARVKALADKK